MKKRFPFPGVTDGVIDGKHIRKQGMAARLFDWLVKKQTSPDGTVNYGKPMTYPQVHLEIPNSPPIGTLRDWFRKLRTQNYIECKLVHSGRPGHRYVVGFTVKILRPKKWSAQLPLFDRISGGYPVQESVEKLRIGGGGVCWNVNGPSVEISTGKSLSTKERATDTNFRPANRAARAEPRRAVPSLYNLEQKARRLQIELEALHAIWDGAQRETPGYAEALLREQMISNDLGHTVREIERARTRERRIG